MNCENENIYLLLSTVFTGSMWIFSEVLASSKCKPNGVFQFVVNGFCINIHKNHEIENHVGETACLISVDAPL